LLFGSIRFSQGLGNIVSELSLVVNLYGLSLRGTQEHDNSERSDDIFHFVM
jgi:hypothetical protein